MDFTEVPRWQTIKRTLDNGLDVILCPVHRSPMVAVNLWYDVGSQTEKAGERGFAHLFEHLMFEGSKHYPGDFFKHLQKYGAGVNGSTSSDRTNYYEDVPSGILELALAMESDRMGHLVESLDETRLETQKGVVTNEYRQNYANQPYGMVSRIMAETLYPEGHPYSWTTIGLMEEVNAATREQVVAFFERYYVPANASLCIAGDLDPEATFELADRYFGSFRSGTRCPAPQLAENQLAESRRIEMRDSVSLERIYLTWPTVRQLTADDPALSILGEVLAGGRTSRLFQELVVKQKIAQDVSAGQWSRELSGQFSIVVTLRPGASADQARVTIDRVIRDIATIGTDASEVQRIIQKRWSAYLFSLERLGGFGGVADRLNAFNTFTRDPDRLWTDALRYRKVTTEETSKAAQNYLLDKPCLEIHVLPQKRRQVDLDRSAGVTIGEPRVNRVAEPKLVQISGQLSAWLLPRRDWPVAAGGIAAIPAPDLLGNQGSGLALLHKASVMEGTARRTGIELTEAIETLGSGIAPHVDWDGFHLTFHATADGLLPTWEIAQEIWQEASFPEADWQRQRDRMITAQKAETDRLESLAQRAFLIGLFGTHHRFGRPLGGTPQGLESLGHADLAMVQSFLNQPDHLHVVLAGDFEESRILPKLESFATSLRTGSLNQRSTNADQTAPTATTGPSLIVVDKPGALQAVIRLGQIGLTTLDPDRDALSLWNLSLGGLFTSRLNHVLREEKGLTYGVRSGFDSRRGMAGAFLVASSVQHDRCAEAIETVRHEVFEMLGQRPLTTTELEDARRNRLEATSRTDDTCASAAQRLIDLWLAGYAASETNDQINRLQSLTLEQVQETAHRRLNPHHWVTVLVADWSKVRPEVEGLGFDHIQIYSPEDLLKG